MTDQNKKNIMANEQGSALILVMILMSVLAIIGFSSINTTTIELQIVRNERIYQNNFYKAESAALEGLQFLEEATFDQLDDRSFSTFIWLKQDDDAVDMTDTVNWSAANSALAAIPGSDYSVREKGIASGGSLDMSATSNLYDYVSRGYGYAQNGKALIEIGYKKRH